MLILYKYHSDPNQLINFKKNLKIYPDFAYYEAVKQNKRIPELEPTILKDINIAIEYAAEFIHNRWTKLEKILLKQNLIKLALSYSNILDIRWPELEKILLKSKNFEDMTQYCAMHDFRSPELEQLILNNDININDDDLSIYIDCVIHEPWPHAEHIIIQNPRSAYIYAKRILKSRWHKAEPIIQSIPHIWNEYSKLFR